MRCSQSRTLDHRRTQCANTPASKQLSNLCFIEREEKGGVGGSIMYQMFSMTNEN